MFKTIDKKIFLIVCCCTIFIFAAVFCSCAKSNNKTYDISSQVSKDQLELMQSDNLNVAICPDYPPFCYLDNGAVVGIDVEIAKIIAKSLDLKLQIIPYNYEVISEKARKGAYFDIIVSAVVINDSRRKVMDFSNPYYVSSDDMIFIAKQESNYTEENFETNVSEGKARIAVYYNSSYKDKLLEMYPKANIVEIHDESEGLVNVVKENKADMSLADSVYFDREDDKNSYKVVKKFPVDEEFGICVVKNKPNLLHAINLILEQIKSDSTLDNIINEFMNKQ